MSKTFDIRTREEMYLAKAAGKSVDVSTLTPPVPTNATEELLLEIDKRFKDAEKGTDATTTKAGVVKQAANVAKAAGDAPTAAEFGALIDALVAAGIMAAPASASN